MTSPRSIPPWSDDDQPWQYMLKPRRCAAPFPLSGESDFAFAVTRTNLRCGRRREERVRALAPAGDFTFPPGARTLVNVGSVGQPRNLFPESCYVIYNRIAPSIQFRFVPYNVREPNGKSWPLAFRAFSHNDWRSGGKRTDWQLVGFQVRWTSKYLMMLSRRFAAQCYSSTSMAVGIGHLRPFGRTAS